MSASIIPAMQRLIAILEAENSALEEARIPDALALLPDKQNAAKTLEQEVAVANDRKKDLCPCCPDDEEGAVQQEFSVFPYRDLLEQMTELGNRNGELLQRAITAQKRVIELLTSTPAATLPQNYSNQGAYAPASERQAFFTSRV